MSCFNTFDMVAVQEFTGYRGRHAAVMREFDRIGATKAKFFWQFPTPFDDLIKKSPMKMQGQLYKPGVLNCCIGNYRILKTAYELGMDNVLICEDDCRWLTDLDLLHDVVVRMPDDADYCKFEWFFGVGQTPEERRAIVGRKRINGYWIDAHGVKSVGAAACWYNRKGMKWKIDAWERCIANPGAEKMYCIDMYDRPPRMPEDLRAYLAMPLAAVQMDMASSMHETSKDYSLLTESGTTEGYGTRDGARESGQEGK